MSQTMMDPPELSTKQARARLEHSRHELLHHMRQDRAPHSVSADAGSPEQPQARFNPQQGPAQRPATSLHGTDDGGLGATWHSLQHTARAWWQSHPAHLALEVAEPLFDKYVRAHPGKVLTLAAATGAALVLTQPWRLISVTGLWVAAARSTPMSALAAALLRPQSPAPLHRHQADQAQAASHPAPSQPGPAGRGSEPHFRSTHP